MSTKAEILAMLHAPADAGWLDGTAGYLDAATLGVGDPPGAFYRPTDANGLPFVDDATGGTIYWTHDWTLAVSHATLSPELAAKATRVTLPAAPAAHPLDSAPVGTTAIKTTNGTVTLPADFGAVSAPDPTDAIHTSATPPSTTLQKTATGIEVQAKVPSGLRAELGYALHAVKATVAEALAWLEKEWREKVEHKAA